MLGEGVGEGVGGGGEECLSVCNCTSCQKCVLVVMLTLS